MYSVRSLTKVKMVNDMSEYTKSHSEPDFMRSSGSGTGSTQPREYN
jgi:hypothetical protein